MVVRFVGDVLLLVPPVLFRDVELFDPLPVELERGVELAFVPEEPAFVPDELVFARVAPPFVADPPLDAVPLFDAELVLDAPPELAFDALLFAAEPLFAVVVFADPDRVVPLEPLDELEDRARDRFLPSPMSGSTRFPASATPPATSATVDATLPTPLPTPLRTRFTTFPGSTCSLPQPMCG